MLIYNLHTFCAPGTEREGCEEDGALERSEANPRKGTFSPWGINYVLEKTRAEITFQEGAKKPFGTNLAQTGVIDISH